jgi:hypothetical protein
MPSIRCVFVGLMLGALSTGAMAGTITDPAMSMDAGSFSTPLGAFNSFTPTNGGGVLDLFNDTGELITSIEFQTNLPAGMTPRAVEALFSCNNASDLTLANPFFLNCSVDYNPNSGQLSILFSGVNPVTGDVFVNNGVGTDQGIPPLLPGCTVPTADTPLCAVQAHFAISFNDNFVFTGPPSGGWSTTSNPSLFPSQPTFGPPTVTLEQLTPEPSPAILVAAGLLTLAALSRRGVRARIGIRE